MKLFRQAYEQVNGLPIGCTEVEYLESTGTQYIDTGVIIASFPMSVETCFSGSMETNDTYQVVVGSDDQYLIGLISGKPHFGFKYNYKVFDTNFPDFTDKIYTVKNNITSDGMNITIDGDEYIRPHSFVPKSEKLNLFSSKYPSKPIKMRYSKIWDNNLLVRDFIPVLDWDMKPCMYDKVSGELFYNKATSGDDFSYGRQVHQVEYLESVSSTNVAYISTNLKPTTNTNFETKVRYNSNSTMLTWALGASTWWGVHKVGTSGQIGITNSSATVSRAYANYTDGTDVTLKLDGTNVYIDGNLIGTITKTNATSTLDLFRYYNSSNLWWNGRIYYFKADENGTPVLDMVPAIDENGVGFMFDRVTHTAYLNAGSGEFIYGNEIPKYKTRLGFVRQMGGALRRLPKGFTEVEYLESTGTQWIDTGYIPTNSTGYKLKHTICEDNSTDNIIIGCREDSTHTRFWEDIDWGSSDTLSWGYGTYSNNDLSHRWSLVGKAGNVVESGCNYYNSRNCFVNDEIKLLPQPESPKITRPMYLFCANNVGSTAYFIKSKIYYVKITEGSTLVRYFIPCLDASDTPCMYDIVEGKAYYNKSTSTFLYGEKKPARYLATPKVRLEVPAIYKKLNYLESTGTQYIDTGIIGTNANMGIDVDWAFSNNNSNMCIFSSRSAQTSNTFTLFWLKTASNQVRFDGVGQRYFTDAVNASVSDDIFNFNYKSTTDAVATLTNKTTEHIQTLYVGKIETFSTKPLYLFCSKDTAKLYSWIKMYGCKIYDGDTVVRDFIPVLRKSDNKPGMYDKVNQIFYVNAASGVDFNYG